jgi:hypothetical protein
MSKKFIITESEKNDIRRMYGLIKEQSSKRISIEGKQPVNGTDWDLVHGILGSKRIDDDLEKRVGDVLQSGNLRVSNVFVTSKKLGNEIITTGVVDLVIPSQGQNPHKYFTTRGSIGGDYEQRHDTQVKGLEDRLKSYYKGEVTLFGPYTIDVVGTNYKFKQSFFAIEGSGSQQQSQSNQTQQQTQTTNSKPISIVGTDITDLRTKLKSETAGKSINIGSIKIDISSKTITYSLGETKIQNMSLIFDPNQDTLNTRMQSIKDKNPTLEIIKSGGPNEGVYWNLVIIK